MRVLVCGGRDYGKKPGEWQRFADVMDALLPAADEIVEGGAPGADRYARAWAYNRQIPCRTFRADWKRHHHASGPIRNARMIAEGQPDLVVAFPGGAGTRDCVTKARAAGIQVLEVEDCFVNTAEDEGDE